MMIDRIAELRQVEIMTRVVILVGLIFGVFGVARPAMAQYTPGITNYKMLILSGGVDDVRYERRGGLFPVYDTESELARLAMHLRRGQVELSFLGMLETEDAIRSRDRFQHTRRQFSVAWIDGYIPDYRRAVGFERGIRYSVTKETTEQKRVELLTPSATGREQTRVSFFARQQAFWRVALFGDIGVVWDETRNGGSAMLGIGIGLTPNVRFDIGTRGGYLENDDKREKIKSASAFVDLVFRFR